MAEKLAKPSDRLRIDDPVILAPRIERVDRWIPASIAAGSGKAVKRADHFERTLRDRFFEVAACRAHRAANRQ